jgi:nuclear transcription factor Y, gamma
MREYVSYVFISCLTATENWKVQALPLARIKKIMKSEEMIIQELEKEKQSKEDNDNEDTKPSVKFMISGESPVLMSKACELLIRDLTFRAWRHTERNRRRTLQRQDLHSAVGESEVYDFLIDIVPRVVPQSKSNSSPGELPADAAAAHMGAIPGAIPQIPYGIPGVADPAMIGHLPPDQAQQFQYMQVPPGYAAPGGQPTQQQQWMQPPVNNNDNSASTS